VNALQRSRCAQVSHRAGWSVWKREWIKLLLCISKLRLGKKVLPETLTPMLCDPTPNWQLLGDEKTSLSSCTHIRNLQGSWSIIPLPEVGRLSSRLHLWRSHRSTNSCGRYQMKNHYFAFSSCRNPDG